jgi:hypothetical protein
MTIFSTKIGKYFYVIEEGSDDVKIIDGNDFKYENYFRVNKKYFNDKSNAYGIKALIYFIEGKYDEDILWNKYGFDMGLLNQVRQLQNTRGWEYDEFENLPIGIQEKLGPEYVKFIKKLHEEYRKYFDYVDIDALKNFDATHRALKVLNYYNPYILNKARIGETYKSSITNIEGHFFLKVKYSQERSVNGLIMSYDRSINNIAENDPIRECFVSRFGDDGIILSADYNAIQPRIACNLSGIPVPYEKDFYSELLEDIKAPFTDRNEFKNFFLKTLYNYTDESLNVLQKYLPNLYWKVMELKKIFKDKGYVFSMTGRRRKLDVDENTKILNSYIQMAQADIIGEMLCKLVNFLMETKKKSKIIGLISDNFLIDIYIEEREDIILFMKENLQKSGFLPNCFLKLNFNEGKSWAELTPIK